MRAGDASATPHLSGRRRRPAARLRRRRGRLGAALRRGATSISPPPSTAAFVVACSDMFFGSRHNLIMPGDARNMGDGWETKRRRGPGHDWTIVRLGGRGRFGAWRSTRATSRATRRARAVSRPVCRARRELRTREPHGARCSGRLPLQPDARHVVELKADAGEVTHVRLNIFPDGGVARLRLFGNRATQ